MKWSWLPLVLLIAGAAALANQADGPPASSAGKKQPSDKPPAKAEKPKSDTAKESPELAALKAAGEAFLKAFNAHDAKAVAACWSADGDYVDENGQRVHGREALEQEYAAFFAAAPKVQMRVAVESMRVLNADTAVEDGKATLTPMPAGAPGLSRYTAVYVKQDGKWLMASVRDSRIELDSQYGHLADLEWLVGDWGMEHGGEELSVAVSWIGNKNFLKREFTHKQGDKELATSLEIIGFDPVAGRITSWTFTSDGGHAMGNWTPSDNGWFIEVSGATADGTSTSAVNEIIRLDDNTAAWRSMNRFKGDIALPDLAEVILKRK